MTKKQFIAWAKDFRTRKEFADHLGIGVRHLAKIIAGDYPPSPAMELKWLKYNGKIKA